MTYYACSVPRDTVTWRVLAFLVGETAKMLFPELSYPRKQKEFSFTGSQVVSLKITVSSPPASKLPLQTQEI